MNVGHTLNLILLTTLTLATESDMIDIDNYYHIDDIE
jgi:hypothetical protein